MLFAFCSVCGGQRFGNVTYVFMEQRLNLKEFGANGGLIEKTLWCALSFERV